MPNTIRTKSEIIQNLNKLSAEALRDANDLEGRGEVYLASEVKFASDALHAAAKVYGGRK